MESNKLKGKRLKAKGILYCLVLLLSATATYAQSFSFSDLFGQGKKDLQNMEAQIAALNAFETSLRQGYYMLHSEWTAIGNWKNGEYGLHQDYYASLSNVNPVVKNSVDLTVIQSQQQSVISQFNSIASVPGLNANEQSYVQAVAQNVINGCNSDMEELQKVLANGALQMSDDERIKRINELTAAIQDKYLFTCHFAAQVKLLAAERLQDNDQIHTERNLYGIN